MKKMTRRQAKAWLLPIRQKINEMRSGYVESYRGYAITPAVNGVCVRLDHFIEGFTNLIELVTPCVDIGPVRTIQKRLTANTPFTLEDIDAAIRSLNQCENELVKTPIKKVMDAMNTAEIRVLMKERMAA